MSKITSANKSSAKKPYCKVCFDAGKPESDYTSHWVKSLPDKSGNTKITCPTLLDTECRFCFKLGHTAKFCPVIEKNNKSREKAQRAAETKQNKQKVSSNEKKPASYFDVLKYDSDTEEEQEQEDKKVSIIEIKPVENFPVLGTPVKKIEVETKSSWSAIAAKPKPVNLPNISIIPMPPKLVRQTATCDASEKLKPAPWAKDYSKENNTKRWADWSDSDTEEEEETQVGWSTYEDETW